MVPTGSTGAGLTVWLLAAFPILLLVGLVLRSRLGTASNAAISGLAAIAIGALVFGAGREVIAVAIGKGLWTGVWILYVIWTAMLLYQIAAQVGLDETGGVLSSVLPHEIENVLLVAWVFPSFVQGVAGFGTPIAVAAPLLVSMGLRTDQAVVLPLVGYHWSVTFGSMGSSFYMGALTAGLSAADTSLFARQSALVLGCTMLLAGACVAVLYGGVRALRASARMLAVVGGSMFVVLNVVVRVEPAIGSVAAGAAGLAAVAILRLAGRGTAAPIPARPAVILLPYVVLLVAVLAVFLPPRSRAFVTSHALIGPSFPATETAAGAANAAVDLYTPIALLGHPGTYILLAAVSGLAIYRLTSLWPERALRPTVGAWLGKVRRASLPVLSLTTLAAVMVDTGMVRTIATGAAAVTGSVYPVIAPMMGALGSFTTGSTTTSNALLAALQRDVAELVGFPVSTMLAAQTAGGNVGNAIAPVVILIGATAIGTADQEERILRQTLGPCIILLGLVAALAVVMPSIG